MSGTVDESDWCMRPHGLPSIMHSRQVEIMSEPRYNWPPPQEIHQQTLQQEMAEVFIATPTIRGSGDPSALQLQQHPHLHQPQYQQPVHPQYHLMQTPQQQLQQNQPQRLQNHPHARHYTPTNPTPGPSGVARMGTQWYTPPRASSYFNNDLPIRSVPVPLFSTLISQFVSLP